MLLAGLLLAAGCAHVIRHPAANAAGTAQANSIPPVAAAGPTSGEHLGTVEVIGTRQRFVLIETPALQPISPLANGQALVCRAAGGATATLRVSPERRPPYVVADVVSGVPHVGDEVFFDHGSAPAAIPAAGVTAATQPAPSSPTPLPKPDFRADPGLPPDR